MQQTVLYFYVCPAESLEQPSLLFGIVLEFARTHYAYSCHIHFRTLFAIILYCPGHQFNCYPYSGHLFWRIFGQLFVLTAYF